MARRRGFCSSKYPYRHVECRIGRHEEIYPLLLREAFYLPTQFFGGFLPAAITTVVKRKMEPLIAFCTSRGYAARAHDGWRGAWHDEGEARGEEEKEDGGLEEEGKEVVKGAPKFCSSGGRK